MLGLPFIDEQPPGESIELDEELLGEEVVIWVLEKHNNDVVRDGEAMRVSGTLSEFNDYDVVLKNGRCSGSCSVAKQMDGSVLHKKFLLQRLWLPKQEKQLHGSLWAGN